MRVFRSIFRFVRIGAVLAMCVTTIAVHAQWRGEFAPVDTTALRDELNCLGLDSETDAIAHGLVDAYDQQYRQLDAGQARLLQWFRSRMVPVEGSSRRMAETYNGEAYSLHQARLRLSTELADTLFDDLRMFLAEHGALVDRLERAARRRRVLDQRNVGSSAAGCEAGFDALAWVEREMRDAALIEDIRAATTDDAIRADALLIEFEKSMPDRAMVFLRVLNGLEIEADMKVREALGEELRSLFRSLQKDTNAIAGAMNAIAETVASMLPPDLTESFSRERIRRTRAWLDGYRLEADLALVRSRLTDSDTALRTALDAFEIRYLRTRDDAGARLRDDYRRFVESDWWVEARVLDTGEDGDDISNTMYQELYDTYRAASVFWTERLDAFKRELEQLAGDRLGVEK